MSSSALDRSTISVTTCKAVGAFTRRVRELALGERPLGEGPHGSHRLSAAGVSSLIVVAGSGIAPAMSILRTMADARDRAPVQRVYGIRSIDAATFAEALDALRTELDLRVDYVASRGAQGWAGRHGRIQAMARLGVPSGHVHAERC